MSDYSRILDENENLCGLWYASPEMAKDALELSMHFRHLGAKELSMEVLIAIRLTNYAQRRPSKECGTKYL
jgi:hypothetical protein